MRCFPAFAALALCGGLAFAQDPANPPTPARSWEQLIQAQNSALERLGQIRESIQAAAPEDQRKMADEFRATASQLQSEILPQLEQQLPQAMQQRPDDPEVLDVAEQLMQFDYAQNKFIQSERIAQLLLKKDPAHQMAMNFSGANHFAEHQFQQAAALLNRAKEQNLLIPQLGGHYLEMSELYVPYWEKEQQIRAREAAATGDEQLPQVLLKTSRGDITLELFENEAPNTVANFISLVEKKFYDGLRFHRVIPNFMAQGGCPHSRDGDNQPAGSGGPGYNIECECYRPDARRHFAGSISMAHAGKNTGGSQFFLTHLPTPHLDQEIAPESVHTVFGRVASGLDVARALQQEDQIISATVIRKRNHPYEPQTLPE